MVWEELSSSQIKEHEHDTQL